MTEQNLLWRRVAALRGIHVPERGARAYVSGERFLVQVSRVDATKTDEIERVGRVVSDPSCQGVIGEIVGSPDGSPDHDEIPRRARIPTLRGYVLAPLGWRGALIEREAARLVDLQPERRTS
jgi:hypothetical protein